MISKTITVDGKELRMRASALIPKLYRRTFDRDMVADMNQLKRAYEKAVRASGEGSSEDERKDAQLSAMDLTIFENVAWLMTRHADPANVADNPDDWLDSFDGIFSVYEILPQILDLWQGNQRTTSVPAKK